MRAFDGRMNMILESVFELWIENLKGKGKGKKVRTNTSEKDQDMNTFEKYVCYKKFILNFNDIDMRKY